MQKTIITICLIGTGLIILDSVNALHLLMLFVLAGVIPGTHLLIAPIDMMAAAATGITIVVLRITLWKSVRPIFFTPEAVALPISPAAKRSLRSLT